MIGGRGRRAWPDARLKCRRKFQIRRRRYDGDGKRNILPTERPMPIVIGSTANYLFSMGWSAARRGLQESRPHQSAVGKADYDPTSRGDLTIQHPPLEMGGGWWWSN